ncbi:MAG: lysophospholipid acyltransferase family protein [Burkholderiales bacterium]|nr:lysophospholipid acyltransferase family protein [Burkholderiales bacterium]
MLTYVLRPIAWMPLSWLHRAGALLGWLVYRLSGVYSARLRQNLRQSGLYADEREYERLCRAAVAEAGKTALESIAIWLGDPRRLMRWITEVRNLPDLEQARRAGRGILLLTPHLGCFEIAGFYFGQMMPITILYRPPRARALEPLMIRGRRRGQTQLATTDMSGVKRLLKALRKGDAVGMLPDQAPRFGEGVWAPFFGRPAFTMTLATRLQRSTGCASFMVFAERLPKGRGYRLHIDPLGDACASEAELNHAIERAIRLRPEQYLWGYDRYKMPRAVPPPAAMPIRGEQNP